MNRSPLRNSPDRCDATTDDRAERHNDKGFTLVEILIAIVLVGILSAVVVVGISNLTSKGSKSACDASADAAKAGAVIYFASANPNAYPASLYAMTQVTPATTINGVSNAAVPAALTLPSNVTVASNANVTGGASWTLTMTPNGTAVAPTFGCTTP